jgi:hypothetical protein
MSYAPIALFVYKRTQHTRYTIENLMKCPEFSDSSLYVFSDAAKKPEDEERVKEVRNLVHTMLGDRAKIVKANTNQGLARSIIGGVSSLLNEYDRVIVLEDDLLVSNRFLTYMNAALTAYQDEPSVMQVSGYMFPVEEFIDRDKAIILPFISSWGWGTWRRAWQHFDPNATGWEILKNDITMRSRFNLGGAYDYFEMIEAQMSGNADSWAIRWYWSVFKHHGYVVYPPISHIDNIGLDGSGTHGAWTGTKFTRQSKKTPSLNTVFPKDIEINPRDFQLVKSSIRGGKFQVLFLVFRFASKIAKFFLKLKMLK